MALSAARWPTPMLQPTHPQLCWHSVGRSWVKGPDGERVIEGGDLFAGFLESSLEPTELITEIRIPKHTGAGWGVEKSTAVHRTGPSLVPQFSESTARPASLW